jgi:hypothetical protein
MSYSSDPSGDSCESAIESHFLNSPELSWISWDLLSLHYFDELSLSPYFSSSYSSIRSYWNCRQLNFLKKRSVFEGLSICFKYNGGNGNFKF